MMSSVLRVNEASALAGDRHTRGPSGTHGNYHSAILLVFLLSTLGIVLAFAPILILPSYQPVVFAMHVTKFTTIFGGVFALSVAITSLCFLFGKRKLEEKRYVRFPITSHKDHRVSHYDNEQRDRRPLSFRIFKNVQRFQIVIFGIGGAIYLIVGFVQIVYSQVTSDKIAATVQTFLGIIALVSQAVFFIKYERASFKSVTLLHYAIALMLAGMVWAWVSLTLSSVAEIGQPSNNSSTTEFSHKVFETSQSLLEPFYIEFLTTCIGILIHMWSSLGNELERRNEFDESESDDESFSFYQNYGSIITDSVEERRLRSRVDDLQTGRDWFCCRDSEVSSTTAKRVCILLSVTISVGYTVAGLFLRDGPLEYISDSFGPYNRWTTLVLIKYFIFGSLTVFCMVAAYGLYKSTTRHPAPLSPNDYLLLVTTAGFFIWYLFKLIAVSILVSIEDNISSFHLYYILTQLFYTLHTWVQTQFLLGAHSVHRIGSPLPKLTKACLIYLACINTSDWLQTALERDTLLHEYSSITPVLMAVYGSTGTQILVYVFYPMIELLRFHSAVMAYEFLV